MRRATKILTALGSVAAAAAVERAFFAAPRYRGPVTDHFDGQHFHNPGPGLQSERAFLKWALNRQPGHWPRWIDAPYGLPLGQVIIGRSPQIVQMRERIERVAATGTRVLIRGESGTGKGLVANALHRQSARRDRPFVKLNCAAIPAHLIEDELFGHVRGAITDARTAKPGLFEEAHRGSLFLDEIGDMELSLQSRLLRVLEDRRVRRLGETQDRQVDVRVIAATNHNLELMVGEGRFREDLYFRLATVPLDVPPLRERDGDIRLLFTHFLESFCAQNQRRRLTMEDAVMPRLLAIFGTDPIGVDQLPSAVLLEAARLLDIQRTYLHRTALKIERPS